MLDMNEPNDSKPDEDMSPVTNLMSDFLAISQTKNSCSVHEKCEVSCANERFRFEPLVVGTRKLRLSNSLKEIDSTGSESPAISEHNASRAKTFIHKPLVCPSERIRLLEIKPARLRTDHIVVTVADFPLDQAPDFDALSYFWGPPQFGAEIIVNGAALAITSNLAGSLRRYRQQSDKRRCLLWVDAVCINQSDKLELNKQLLLMRRIYQQARMVYIDLGDVGLEWYLGFDLLHKLSFIYGWVKDSPEQDFSLISVRYGIPPLDHAAWEEYYWLFTMPWFTRTWIVQEAAWARESEIMFGLFTFRWDALVDSWNLLVQFGLLQPSFGDLRVSKGLLGLRDILKVCDICRRGGFSNMIQVMRLTREFKTTDARDRCFAVFSLLGHGPVGQGFTPDYTLPVEKVYEQFATYLVQIGEGPAMLSYAGLQRRRNIVGIPSWVPDWTLQSPALAPKALLTIRNESYHAADFAEPYIVRADPSSHLDTSIIVKGAVVDHIMTLSEPYSDQESPSSLNEDLLAWHQTTSAIYTTALDQQQLIYSNPADAFARTLLVDDTYSGANACQTTTPITDPVSTHARAFSLETPGSPVWLGARARRDEVSTFRLQLMAAGSGRRFAITKKGRMGLVPWCAEVGDGVCVVLGSGVLFVVRRGSQGLQKEAGKGEDRVRESYEKKIEKQEIGNEYLGKQKGSEDDGNLANGEEDALLKERWTLVGDAYVYGLMDGEALSQDEFQARQMRFCSSQERETLTCESAEAKPPRVAPFFASRKWIGEK